MESTGDLVLYRKELCRRLLFCGWCNKYGFAYDVKVWAISDSRVCPYGWSIRNALVTDGQLYVLPQTGPHLPLYGTGIVIPADQMPATLELTDSGNLEVRSGRVIADIKVRDVREPTAYSDLSPFTEVDAGPNAGDGTCSEMEWTLEGVEPPERCDHIELWRTSSDQSLVLYRLEVFGKGRKWGGHYSREDTLTDEELFDPDRPNYAALPVVLPNGSSQCFQVW